MYGNVVPGGGECHDGNLVKQLAVTDRSGVRFSVGWIQHGYIHGDGRDIVNRPDRGSDGDVERHLSDGDSDVAGFLQRRHADSSAELANGPNARISGSDGGLREDCLRSSSGEEGCHAGQLSRVEFGA